MNSSEAKLIISVDDFGFTQGVNDAVYSLAQKGTISATNIVSNMPFANQAKDISVEFPNLSLGVHINLTQGKPLSPPKSIPSLVTSDGCFFSINVLIKRALLGKVDVADCQREINAQVSYVNEILGSRVNHWNSHHGIHRFPPFFQAAHSVCSSYSIHAMRTHRHGMIVKSLPIVVDRPSVTKLGKFTLRRILIESYYSIIARRSSLRFKMPDATLTKDNTDTAGILKLIASSPLPRGVWEIACHPALSLEDLWGTGLKQERIDEYEILSSDLFSAAIKNNFFHLIGFGDLQE